MNSTEARAAVVAALSDVAPEIEVDALTDEQSLRDGAELDSMDFLAFVAAISDALGADIPEADYPALDGVGKAAAYLAERS